MAEWTLFGIVGSRLAELFQKKEIELIKFLNEWEKEVIERGDMDTLKRINTIRESRVLMAEVQHRWISKDRDYLFDTVYPERKHLKSSNGNGAR